MDTSVRLGGGARGNARGHPRRISWQRWMSCAWRAVVVAVVAGVVLGVVMLACVVTLVPALSGAMTFTVLSGSMQPALPVGSVVIVRSQPTESIRPGDVITFLDRGLDSSATRLVTHRVIEVQQGAGGPWFVTRGDANTAADPGATAAADVRGVLWYHVPWMGSVRGALAGPAGMFYLAAALLVLVAAHLLTAGHARPGRSRR